MRALCFFQCFAFQFLGPLFLCDAFGQLYWVHETIHGAPFTPTPIYQANLDGSNTAPVVASLNHPWDVAIDRETESIYWTESIGDRIARANLDGSAVQTILSVDSPASLAIEFSTSKMYWGGIGLREANVDGTGARLFAGEGQVVTGVAVAPSRQVVYYADHFGNRIGRVPIAGGEENSLISGLLAPPIAVAVDEEHELIYWSDGNADIWRANLTDGTGRTMIYSDIHYSRDIFIDEVNDVLWWSWEEGPVGSPPFGGISHAPIDGSGPVSTLSVPFRPVGIWVEIVPEPNNLVLAVVCVACCRIRKGD
jgi:hypothetical protein